MAKTEQYQEFTFEVPLQTVLNEKTELSGTENSEPGVRRSIAMIGDRFMNRQFFSASTLEKSAPLWENTLHDINHMGTTFRTGFSAQSNILYFVGRQDNVQYDAETKALSMDIHPKLNTHYGQDWQAFIELCEEATLVPNVSISFLGKVKRVQASELPEGSDYVAQGYKETDMVEYIHSVVPRALSTVLQGLCNDKQGCGITTNHSEVDSGPCTVTTDKPSTGNPEEEGDARKRAYFEKRLKNLGAK